MWTKYTYATTTVPSSPSSLVQPSLVGLGSLLHLLFLGVDVSYICNIIIIIHLILSRTIYTTTLLTPLVVLGLKMLPWRLLFRFLDSMLMMVGIPLPSCNSTRLAETFTSLVWLRTREYPFVAECSQFSLITERSGAHSCQYLSRQLRGICVRIR